MTLAEENITQLVAWNAEKLKPDFVLPETSPAQSASAEEVADVETPVGETPDEESLVANPEEKTQMWVKPKSPSFFVTLSKMAAIIVEQMVTIFVVRALFSSNYEGYMGCMFRTITERTWVKYTSSLHTLAMSTTHQVLDSLDAYLTSQSSSIMVCTLFFMLVLGLRDEEPLGLRESSQRSFTEVVWVSAPVRHSKGLPFEMLREVVDLFFSALFYAAPHAYIHVVNVLLNVCTTAGDLSQRRWRCDDIREQV